MSKKDKNAKSKSLGSVRNIQKEDERSFSEKIWDYKPHIIVGVVIILLIFVYVLTVKNLHKAPVEGMDESPVPSKTKAKNVGTLIVKTIPDMGIVEVDDKVKRAPATFTDIEEGNRIVLLSKRGYKKAQKMVEIKKGETTTLEFEFEK